MRGGTLENWFSLFYDSAAISFLPSSSSFLFPLKPQGTLSESLKEYFCLFRLLFLPSHIGYDE